jgi:Reverse transcriptase (RNA-dependent DNA polymerase)
MAGYLKKHDWNIKLYCRLFKPMFPSEIPENFSDGVITLIPKISTPRTVNDFRPISLLNTDYKLFSKILANRLKDSIQKLIENGQSACLNGKSCVTNLIKLRNLIANKGRSRRNKFSIMSLDLEKAFDRVRLAFLWKCLEKMNFPRQFIEVLKALYANAKSRILINGTLTREFRIKNSVRQGCPLSMALFVIYIEPLIQMINCKTAGTTLQQTQIKCMAYADDINFIVTKNDEVDTIFEEINTFCNEANAKINFQKSSFMRVNNCNIGPQMIAEKDFLKILGITLYADIKQTVVKNYEKLLNNINYLINLHQRRNLNIIQKIWFANTFVLSKMWYLSQIIPPENLILAKLRKTIGKFIWNGLLYKINRCQLFMSPKKGGLSLIDIEMKAKALFIKNILYKVEDDTVVPNSDFLLLETTIWGLLTRNMREWLTEAEDLQNGNLTSVKMLYFHFLDLRNHKPRVETEYPNIEWAQIWKNLSHSFLPTDWRANVYMLVNDAVPNAARLRRHRISMDCPVCRVCGNTDDNIHRLRLCAGSVRTWDWLNHKLKNVLRLEIDDPEELLVNGLGRKEEAGLFLTFGVMSYNLKNFKEGSIQEMENSIRRIRWSKRHILEKKFGNLLNIF